MPGTQNKNPVKFTVKLIIRIIIAAAVLIYGFYLMADPNPISSMLCAPLVVVGLILAVSCWATIAHKRDTAPLLCECGQRIAYNDDVTCTPLDSYEDRKQEGTFGNITIYTHTNYLITHTCPKCDKIRKYHYGTISHKEIKNFAGVYIEGYSHSVEERDLRNFFTRIRTHKEVE